MNARGGMPRSRSGLEILHHAQRPVGPFWDYDIFTTSRQPTRFSALTIHHLQVLVNDGDEWGWGGIDNIKDGDSKLAHCFFGIIEVNSRNSISDYGAKILDEKGVNLSPRSGTFFVKIKANFDRYELSGLSAPPAYYTKIDPDTSIPLTFSSIWVRSRDVDNTDATPITKRTVSLATMRTLTNIADVLASGRGGSLSSATAVLRQLIPMNQKYHLQYKDKYPVYPSALNPSTDGPPRNVHKGEVYHELARHADFIKAALMGQRPRQMEASKWDTLQTDANHHRVRFGHGEDKPWEDKSQSEEEEDNLDGDAVLDEQFSVHQDPYPHASAEMSRLRVGTSPPNDEGSRTAYSSSVTPQTVFEDFSPEINNAE
ncbi:hypothetical protein FRB96_006074 [Tulasnella sp. 330]|nr:hypothetical protein FRB96_006074 [Tulasnella sp. 330]